MGTQHTRSRRHRSANRFAPTHPAPAAHPRPVVVVERICHCGGTNPDCGGDLALVYLRRHASQRGPVFDDGPYWLSAACRKRNRGRFRFATPPADPRRHLRTSSAPAAVTATSTPIGKKAS
jgi:hypothetical protein